MSKPTATAIRVLYSRSSRVPQYCKRSRRLVAHDRSCGTASDKEQNRTESRFSLALSLICTRTACTRARVGSFLSEHVAALALHFHGSLGLETGQPNQPKMSNGVVVGMSTTNESRGVGQAGVSSRTEFEVTKVSEPSSVRGRSDKLPRVFRARIQCMCWHSLGTVGTGGSRPGTRVDLRGRSSDVLCTLCFLQLFNRLLRWASTL
jgi:hypothetical protein